MKTAPSTLRMLPALLALLALCLPGCIKAADDARAESTTAEADSEPTNRIDIPPIVRSNLGLTFARVERRHVAATIRIAGAFELQPLARHEYRMTLPGRVELLVDELQPVEPGTLLYRFQSPSWPDLQHEAVQAEQMIESGRADIAVARAMLEEALVKSTLMNERLEALAGADFRRADLEAEAAQLRASLPRLEAELRKAQTSLANGEKTREHAIHRASAVSGISEDELLAEIDHDGVRIPAYRLIDWVEVRATEAGVVEMLGVTNGAFAEPPAVVVSTIDPTKMRFRAMALQADLPRLGGSPVASIVPPTTPGIDIGDSVSAELRIGLEAHPEQRTVTLFATPERTRNWMRPGISAFLEVVVDSTVGPALAIPRSAIVKDGITHVFFRRDPDDPNKAIRVEADLGPSDGRWVAILSGLMLNDEVVLDGAYEMKLASQQDGSAQKGGHFHADGTFHGDDH